MDYASGRDGIVLEKPVRRGRVLFLTGLPGSGKTTLVSRICEHYKSKGLKIAGISTREVREGNERIGFKITDLSSNNEGWLARISEGAGPRVGRYFVAPKDLEEIGVRALNRAVEEDAPLIIVDEIGPMEMTDPAFRTAVSKILESSRMVVATVKYGSHYPEVERVQGEVVRLEVAKDNREAIYRKAIAQLDDWVRRIGN